MRIGIDATALPPQPVGAGNYIIQLIRALSALDTGDELVVFVQEKGLELIGKKECLKFEWVIVRDLEPAARLIWEQVGFPGLVRQSKVDLLHSLHYTRPLWLPCKSVVTFHDLTFFLFPELHTRARRFFFPLAIRASARLAQALIADSESTRQDAIRLLHIAPAKIQTALLGVDPTFRKIDDTGQLQRIRAKYQLPEHFILYVGLVEPRKNLPGLINSYKDLVGEGIDHDLVIVGRSGWSSGAVFSQVEALGLNQRVRFTGYVDQHDLPLVYNLASLFVYPTRYEGFGLPVLEALACGTPVITTNASSLPEIVGDAGILIPPDDAGALLKAMHRVLEDPELMADLSARGMKRAKGFTWERTALQTRQVYRQLCELN